METKRFPLFVDLTGKRAVVIGGGPIGLLVALAAKRRGAEVLVSEVSRQRLDLAAELGFRTVNPAEDDLESVVAEDRWYPPYSAEIRAGRPDRSISCGSRSR